MKQKPKPKRTIYQAEVEATSKAAAFQIIKKNFTNPRIINSERMYRVFVEADLREETEGELE